MNLPEDSSRILHSGHRERLGRPDAPAHQLANDLDAREQRRAALNLLEDAVEARQALEKLNVELRRLADIVESSDDAIVSAALDGTVMTWNGSAERLYGYSAAEAVGRPIDLIIPEERRKEEQELLERLFRGERGEPIETTRRGKDGRLVDVALTVSSMRDADGRVIGSSEVARDISERLRRAKEARSRAGQLTAFMETAAIGLHRVGPDGIIHWVNEAELKMLGYEHDDYVGRHISEFHADPEVIADILERLLRGEILQDREARLKCSDGSIKTVRIDSTPLFEDGRFVHTQCFTTDITGRKRAEHALTESRAQLETELADSRLLHRVSAAISHEENAQALYDQIISAAISIMHSDFASMQMLHPERGGPGSSGELRLLAFRGFNSEAAKSWEWVCADSQTTCGEALRSHKRVIAADIEQCEYIGGEDLAALLQTGIRACQTTPLLSRDGTLVGMISTHWRTPHEPSERDLRLLDILARQAADLIERRAAEEALRESEAKYRTIFNGAAVSLWEEDFSGVAAAIEDLRIEGVRDFRRYFEEHPEFVQKALGLIQVLDVNDASVTMFEAQDKTELLGSLPKIFVPESLPVFIEELVTVAEGRTFMQGEALLNTVQGNPVSTLFTMTLATHTQKHDRVLFSLLDISERVRLERQMQEQAATLADLHRRKDEFLAMLSHELRNPLAPIANAVHLLRLQRGSENQTERYARTIIERQVGQLRHLIDDLLEVSRVTTGKFQLRRERIAIAGIVENAVESARPLIEQRRHQLSIAVPTDPIWLHADAARLEQVVVNLLTNAAKYTDPEGQIALTVEREADMAVLRVRDTGAGISPEFLPHIFDLFAQAERALDRSQGGLGIGLSLAKRLVELHDGTVEAFSTLGQGSEFIVRLPSTVTPSPPAVATEVRHSNAGACRVLVVEDNVDSAESLAMLLRASGHDVRTTHDSRTALPAALDYRPDVVLLDIGLPGLNGFEVARLMRAHGALNDVVLVALTGYGQETDRLLSHEAGFDHHLVKPVDFREVAEILTTVSERAP